MIALSVAAALAVFILYTSIAGGARRSSRRASSAGTPDHVSLVGAVVGPVTGDAHGAGLRFRVKDAPRREVPCPVVYRGSVPDLFRAGRHIVVTGQLRGGDLRREAGSLVTKCPSKYAPAKLDQQH